MELLRIFMVVSMAGGGLGGGGVVLLAFSGRA